MDKQQFLIKGSAALVALVAVAGIATTSFAGNGFGEDVERPSPRMMGNISEEEREVRLGEMEEGRGQASERREKVKAALEAEDYEAWVNAIEEDNSLVENITEENFPRFVEAHELRQEAGEIMEELGVEIKRRGLPREGGFKTKGHAGCMR